MAKPVFPYQSLAREPKFREAASRRITNDELHLLADALGYRCGLTTIQKARKLATKSEPKPEPKRGTPVEYTDEWTVPTSSTRIAEVVETKRAPSQGNLWLRFQIGFDVHGDKQSVEANAAFFRHMEMFQPELRIMGGDLWDLRPLRGGANAEERQESMQRDYLMGLEWLQRFRPQHFLRGNHDERLWEWAENKRGIEQDFARGKCEHIESEIEKLDCKMYRYHIREGILKIGHLQVAHGFFNGVNCARQMASAYGCIIFGHNHMITTQPVHGLERMAARCCGCLSETIFTYNERRPTALTHTQGWPFGVIHRNNGNYHVWQAEKIGDTWMVPSDVVEL